MTQLKLNFHFTVISSKNSGMNLTKEYVLRKKLVMRIRNILSEKNNKYTRCKFLQSAKTSLSGYRMFAAVVPHSVS